MRYLAPYLVVLAALISPPALADDSVVRLIVNRMSDSVEIFAELKADALPDVLQADPSGLAAPDGRVYFGELRSTGTFEFGDQMISKVGFEVGGRSQRLEAMSVMVHPKTNILPFETPVDGVIAMSVCTVPDPVEPPQIEDLRIYSGLIAYPVDGTQSVSLTLPLAEAIDVELVTYVEGRRGETARLSLAPGDSIDLAAAETGWMARLGLSSLWSN